MAQHRLYHDLSWIWPYLSPPDHYVEEVRTFVDRFRRLGVPDGGHILHLGSGGGSIDHNLKQNYRVTGVDRSASMIKIAQAVNPDVEYVEGDIRSVDLGRTFDAVLSHDAIAYMLSFEDLLTTYQTAARHLLSGGAMVAIPEEVRSFFKQHAIRHDATIEREGVMVTTVEVAYDHDPSDSEYECDFIYLIREKGNLRVEMDIHTMGIHDLCEFERAVEQAGFDVTTEAWGLSDIESDYPIMLALKK